MNNIYFIQDQHTLLKPKGNCDMWKKKIGLCGIKSSIGQIRCKILYYITIRDGLLD